VFGFVIATAGAAMASHQQPYRTDDRQVERLLIHVGDLAARLDRSLDGAFDHGQLDDPRARDEIRRSLADFRQAAGRLLDRVRARESNRLDVEEVLRRGGSIDSFMQRYQLRAQAEQNWLSVRSDLDALARTYRVAWRWDEPGAEPAEPGAGFHHRLTGTYQLETNQGDDPRRAAELAARSVPADQRDRTYQGLLARLEAPELIAIERNDDSVTMASTRGRRVTMEADGRDHVERWSAERTMNTRATLQGERLVVATNGNRGRDFTVTFDPMANGLGLHMTRTIDGDGLRQPVTVRSAYRRVSDDARWDIDSSGTRGPYRNSEAGVGEVVVPDGTRLVASLDGVLSTMNAREGDLYTLTTLSPSAYEGAVIEGYVSTVNDSRRLTGRAGMTLNLRSIRLRDGRAYQFDGVIEDIRTPDGERVRVDREGMVDSHGGQAQKVVERSAIGAAIGALIGAVAGGGKGAAIGAVIGAGGGAGTVIVEGRDRLDLRRGTELTIISGDPRNRQE
jgi:hypothetical protein